MGNKIVGYVINHGHMDIEWYMPLRSYRFWTAEALDELRRIAREHKDYVTYVLDGVTYVLDIYLEARPEAWEEIEKLITEKKLTIGPFYTQFDEWLPSGESIVRNCLYGNRSCRKYGNIMKAGYLPDNFGHPLQMPQILNNFGIDSLLFMRGMPEVQGEHPDEFKYIGLDGSSVVVSHFRNSYGGAFRIFDKEVEPMQPRDMPYHQDYFSYEYYMELADHTEQNRIAEELIRNVLNNRNRYPSGIVPLIAGCDHCPPQGKMAETLRLANSMQDEIEFIMGDAEGYIRLVQANAADMMEYDKEFIGSFYQYILFGALSARSYLKRMNFGAEVLMERYTEPLDALASMLGYSGTQPQLDEAWKNLMINSTHDSIHGTSVDEVHIEMEARYAAVGQIAAGLSHDAIKYTGRHMEPWWASQGKGILTFAPAGSEIPQLAQVWLPIGDERIGIYDRYGNALPTQIISREKIELNGVGEPRNSYWPDEKFRNVIFLAAAEANKVDSFVCKAETELFENIKADENYIENEYLRIEVKGAYINILDKETGVWNYGLNLIEEDADAGDAWDYSATSIPSETILSNKFAFSSHLVETGPVRATVEVRGIMEVPFKLLGDERSHKRVEIPLCFEVSLERYAKRADIRLTLENNAKDHRLRLKIPTGIKTDKIISQGQFGIIERHVERDKERKAWRQPPTKILPFREWLAADDGNTGLAIAVKGIYDYEAVINPDNNRTDIYLTLLRGFEYMGRISMLQRRGEASWCHHTPGAQCLGKHVIEWAYIPYKSRIGNKAPFLSLVQSFLYPIMTHMVRAEQAEVKTGGEMLPFAFFDDNIQFSAFKRSYDGTDYILRFFENQGKEVEAKVAVNGFTKAFLSNMNEEIKEEILIKDHTIVINTGAYKVITLLLRRE